MVGVSTSGIHSKSAGRPLLVFAGVAVDIKYIDRSRDRGEAGINGLWKV